MGLDLLRPFVRRWLENEHASAETLLLAMQLKPSDSTDIVLLELTRLREIELVAVAGVELVLELERVDVDERGFAGGLPATVDFQQSAALGVLAFVGALLDGQWEKARLVSHLLEQNILCSTMFDTRGRS